MFSAAAKRQATFPPTVSYSYSTRIQTNPSLSRKRNMQCSVSNTVASLLFWLEAFCLLPASKHPPSPAGPGPGTAGPACREPQLLQLPVLRRQSTCAATRHLLTGQRPVATLFLGMLIKHHDSPMRQAGDIVPISWQKCQTGLSGATRSRREVAQPMAPSARRGGRPKPSPGRQSHLRVVGQRCLPGQRGRGGREMLRGAATAQAQGSWSRDAPSGRLLPKAGG